MSLFELFKLLESYSRKLSRIEEQISNLVYDLSVNLSQMSVCDCVAAKTKKENLKGDKAKNTMADPKAFSLKLVYCADDSAEACIDWGKPVKLTATLAALLEILADKNTGVSDDDLIGWKTYAEVAEALKQKTGKILDKHAIHQNIYRLRIELMRQRGLSPKLIQTNPRLGLRFALLRKLPGSLEHDVKEPQSE